MIFSKSLVCSIFDTINKLFLVTVVDGLSGFFLDTASFSRVREHSLIQRQVKWLCRYYVRTADWPSGQSLCQEFKLCSEENWVDLETAIDMQHVTTERQNRVLEDLLLHFSFPAITKLSSTLPLLLAVPKIACYFLIKLLPSTNLLSS